MNANEITETKEVKWIIEHSQRQIDFDGSEIPGSAYFNCRLPLSMIQAVKKMFKDAGASIADGSRTTTYSISSGETEKDFSLSATFGGTKGTANRLKFNLSPFTW